MMIKTKEILRDGRRSVPLCRYSWTFVSVYLLKLNGIEGGIVLDSFHYDIVELFPFPYASCFIKR